MVFNEKVVLIGAVSEKQGSFFSARDPVLLYDTVHLR
jgi:hypothetical protein